MAGEVPWAERWTDDAVARRFGPDTLARGRRYAEAGQVERHQVSRTPLAPLLTGTVRGSGGRLYQTVVSGRADGAVASHCSCPIGVDCKHAVAVLLVARAELQREARAGRVPLASWEQILRPVVADAAPARAATPLALEFSGSPSALRLRPLVPGRSGRWIRTGVSWEDLNSDPAGAYVPGHRLALRDVRRSAERDGFYGGNWGRSAELTLTHLRPGVWAALRAARDAGVTFLSVDGTPDVRVLDDPAILLLEVDPGTADSSAPGEGSPPGAEGLPPDADGGGGLVVRARVRIPGVPTGTPLHLVGSPTHGLVAHSGREALLAGFEHPLTPPQQALLGRGPIRVPPADVATFAGAYLPGLRRSFEVRIADGLELPAAEPPVLTLTVTFQPPARARLTWALRYRIGGSDTLLDPLPRPADPPLRDPDAERELFAALPPGLWPTTELAGDTRPVADAVLAGRDLIDFVSESLPALRDLEGLEVTVRGDLPDYREATDAPQVSLAITEGEGGVRDWFNLAVDVTIDGETVPFAELFRALASGQDHLVLDSGVWFELDRPELDQLRQLIEEAGDLGPGGPGELRLRPEHAGLWEELVRLGVVAEQAEAWRTAVRGLLAPDELPPVSPPTQLRATLRPYQAEGLAWLRFLWDARLGGVLADDMGLGKTLQMLALVASVQEAGALDHPVLVVAPTSVLGTWRSEAERFTPGLRVRVVERTSAKRSASVGELAADADVVVTSYTLLRLDAAEYTAQPWAALVLDEAQFVKNRQSKAYRAVRGLRAGVRFAITGTPLENNLMDLWSLLSITSPGLFPDPEVFAERYRRPIEGRTDADALPRLRRRIRPVMLRRTKESVATELPPKQEQVLAVPLAPAHRRLYDRQLQAERKKVLGLVDDLTRNRITILRSLTLLRQLALSPALVDPSLPAASAKVDTLVELLTEVSAEGHRALVFSQFTSFLALVRRRLDAEGIGHQYLDGRTRDRAARIEAFRSGDDPAFLISLKAGGFGLTLTEADYVFVLDPWWNPAAELQAIDRTHRIGQDKHVMVYRLVSADTIEEKVVALQDRKRDLFAQVVGADAELAAPLRAEDIRALLEP